VKPCEGFSELLIDLSCGLLDGPQAEACRRHLEGCPACSAEWRRLDRMMTALTPETVFPRENEVDWDGFARRTIARATAARPGLLTRLAAFAPRWSPGMAPAWAAAAVLLVVVSVTVLLLDRPPTGPEVATGPAVPLSTSHDNGGDDDSVFMSEPNIDHLTVNLARENTARYLTETRSVLVTLLDVNIHCEKGKVDISAERAKATELLRRQRLIAAELHRLPLARAKDVCGDLERLLLEISSLADCTRDDEIQTLRDVVDKRQILVRMELLSQELARQEGAHA